MKITFEPSARDELDYIFRWIATDNPRAASELVARIESRVMRLAAPNLAHMGRPGLVEGTRELIEYPTSLSTESMMIGRKLLSFRSSTARKIGRLEGNRRVRRLLWSSSR